MATNQIDGGGGIGGGGINLPVERARQEAAGRKPALRFRVPDDRTVDFDDLVRGLMGLMDSPDHITGPINIGNPGEFTIRQLAEQVIDLTGSKSQLVFIPLPQDDPKQRQPNIEKAREILGWEPKVQLRDGLTKTIAYFDGMLSHKLAAE